MLPPLWRRRPLATVGLLVALAAGVAAHWLKPSGSSADDYGRYHRKPFKVVKVVDGDTLDLDVPDGRHTRTRVRLWGVDSPEVAAGGRGEMHFGPEASAYARSELDGREVVVLLVQGKTRDRYGRLLAYLMLPGDDRTFNERLVESGHAYADGRFDHPYKERFSAVERHARQQGRGLWANVRDDQMPAWRQRMERKATTRSSSRSSRSTSGVLEFRSGVIRRRPVSPTHPVVP